MEHFISHRGNINGKIPSEENKPAYINLALTKGYDVEIDVWLVDGVLYLGHDKPEYIVGYIWLFKRSTKLWIHCKNKEAMVYFNMLNNTFNYFWHDIDDMTLTSKGFIWVYPNKQPIENSIAVLPELHNDDTSVCLGICSDYIEKYKNDFINLRD